MSARMTVSLSSEGHDIPALRAAARAFAQARGASAPETEALAVTVGYLAEWVSRNCFPAPSTGTIDVTLLATEDGVQLTLTDDGIPLATFGSGLGRIPEDLRELDGQVVDLHLVHLGTRGKKLRCLLPTGSPLVIDVSDEQAQVQVEPGDIEVRLTRPDDAQGVGRVIHAVYGLIYMHVHDEFYDADRLVAAWARGDIVSTVATVRGEIVGHMAAFREASGRVFEMGAAVVDPRFRSLGFVHMLGEALGVEVLARQAWALSLTIVTTHTRTQSAPAQHGFVATGLLLGAAPGAEPGLPRSTLLQAYLPLRRMPRPVALPSSPTYVDALTAVYAQLGLDLIPQDAGTALAEIGDAGSVELAPHPGDRSPALITIRRWGPAEHDELIDAMRSAVATDAAMVYIDLDLHTLTREQLDDIREFLSYYDFFASGLMLYGNFGHDHIRLQAMLSRDLELDDILLLTESARLVRAAVFRDHSQLAQRVDPAD